MSRHLLIYEPRTEGHHLGWLRFLTEDLLAGGFELSLAVDLRPRSRPLLEDHLADLLPYVKLRSAYDSAGRRHSVGGAASVAFCLRESGAEQVFLAAFDEIASACWRRAALGLNPPAELRRRFGGIYHRPRFFVAPPWSPNRLLKLAGFRRLIRQGWLSQLLFVDEYLTSALRKKWPGAPFFFLPDPCPADFDGDSPTARRELQLPQDKCIFLFFGTGQRRKGLRLAIQALLGLPPAEPAYLLCAGQLNPQGETARGLDQLVAQGRARLINRYVSAAEEKLCFAAADVVLLPYLNHFGTSGVLSRAMAAGKMVIASDAQLLGRLTRERGLGLLFQPHDPVQLRDRIGQAAHLRPEELAKWADAARHYAQEYSRAAYRAALLASLDGGSGRSD